MKTTESILDKAGRRDGMTVPEGFFGEFVGRMSSSLPVRPEAETPVRIIPPKTMWERLRPYVYLAAMFAGIWCMLKMFTLMNPANVDLSIDKNHILTEALGDDNFVYDYIIDDINDRELFEEMYDDSISVGDMLPADSLPQADTGTEGGDGPQAVD